MIKGRREFPAVLLAWLFLLWSLYIVKDLVCSSFSFYCSHIVMLKCSRWLLFTHSVSVTFPRKLGGFFCVFLTSWWVFQVPSGLRGQAHLKVWGNRHLAGDGYIFHNYTTVTIDSKGSSVFIQTDKPVYKPKQKGKVTLQNLPDAWAAFKQNL